MNQQTTLIPRSLKAPVLSIPLRISECVLALIVLACLIQLAIRAGLRLEGRWDTFMYHLPFAAIRGGLDIPYEMNERLALAFQGFPPLAHWAQGILWRLSGTPNATGVVNFLAFGSFLFICHRLLRAPFYVIAAIALTAPLVLIHTTVSYIDLFGNSWLALGIVCLFTAYYFDRSNEYAILITGLMALVMAAWTKFQLTPLVAFFFVLYLVTFWGQRLGKHTWNCSIYHRPLFWILSAGLLAAIPYLGNWIKYGSPFWPVPVPFLREYLPYSPLFDRQLRPSQIPPPLVGRSDVELFFRSLFEIGHPHQYERRPRWIIDQGNAWIAFRSGGLWNVSVVTYLSLASMMACALDIRKGARVVLVGILTVLFLSILPASYELRYYLFLPLAWAGIIGALYPSLRRESKALTLILVLTALGLFFYVSAINRDYYKIERVSYSDHAKVMESWWAKMESDVTYCAVDMVPIAMLLTGPTMSEFRVIDRSRSELCPSGSVILENDTVATEPADLMQRALNAIYRRRDYAGAIRILDKMLVNWPNHYGAMWQRAVALERLGQVQEAIDAWQRVVTEAQDKGYVDAGPAHQRLNKLKTTPQFQGRP